MDTSFNNTQNFAASGFDGEAVQNSRSLEQRLEASEARTRCLLAALPQIVWLAEPKGAIAQFNQRWYEYTGLTEAESLGWEFLKALHPEDRDCFVACCHLASKKLQTYKIECRLLGLDGTYRWFIGSQTPVITADGQLFEWVGTYLLKGQPEQYLAASWRERAEGYTLGRSPSQLRGELATQLVGGNQQPANLRVRKKAVNHTVKLAQQSLRNLINELSHAIVWEADSTTEQFTFVSQSAEGLLGYPVEQWLSQPDFWVNIIHPEDRQWTVALSRKEMFQNRDYELEYRCLAADHRVVWLRDRACVVRDDQGRAQKRRGLMVDITLAKQAGEVLEARIAYQRTNEALNATTAQLAQTTTLLNKTIAALERRTQELDEFAYITSHDLKAPLRAIANLSQWIEDDIADQLHAENLRQMQLLRGRVYRLEALLNGLLEYSRAGRLHSEPEGVEVEALLIKVIDTFAPPAQFTIEVAPGMPSLVTEHLPLEQVFAHLIGNAIKHHPSPDGTVTISVQEQSDAYEFAVADDGAGIAPQFQERVFSIFQSVKAKETLENIGVGLAIAKRIVESLGGSIRLESQEGRGSTFYFTWSK